MTARRIRRASRILLRDMDGRILLFRFTPADRPPFWCTPGGQCDPGETFEAAAARELFEETGLEAVCGAIVARRGGDFVTIEGEPVTADEAYFLVETACVEISADNHTVLEQEVMREWRWFAPHEIAGWPEPIFPVDLVGMLATVAPAPSADPDSAPSPLPRA